MSTELTVYDKFKKELSVFKAADAELVFDVTTSEGYADCKAYHVKLRKVWNGVNNLRLDTSKSLRQEVDDINTDGNAILAEIDAIANPRKAQFEEEDAKEAKIIADLAEKNRLAAELEVDERLAHLENGERDLQAAKDKLKAEAVALKATADRIERETTAAAVTAKAVEVAVEVAVQETIVTETAKTSIVNDKRIAKELEEKNKKDAEDEVERVWVADVEHRKEIEKKTIDYLALLLDDFVSAEIIVKAITLGQIPGIEFKY